MSRYATAYLSDGRALCHFRNGVDELFLRLFTSADRVRLTGPRAWRFGTYPHRVARGGTAPLCVKQGLEVLFCRA